MARLFQCGVGNALPLEVPQSVQEGDATPPMRTTSVVATRADTSVCLGAQRSEAQRGCRITVLEE